MAAQSLRRLCSGGTAFALAGFGFASINGMSASTDATKEKKLSKSRKPEPHGGVVKDIQAIREHYTTIDYTPDYKKMGAWHSTMRGKGKVEHMELYFNDEDRSVAGRYHLGCSLCGHRGIIHGGIIAMAFDDTFGICFHTQVSQKLGVGQGFTANLDVNYRKPMPCASPVVFHSKIDRVEGRKVFISGYATDEKGENWYADSTALFVIPREKKES